MKRNRDGSYTRTHTEIERGKEREKAIRTKGVILQLLLILRHTEKEIEEGGGKEEVGREIEIRLL